MKWNVNQHFSEVSIKKNPHLTQQFNETWIKLNNVRIKVQQLSYKWLIGKDRRQNSYHFYLFCINTSHKHWLRKLLIAFSGPSHYLNQCCLNAIWTIANKFLWNLKKIQHVLFKKVNLKMLSAMRRQNTVSLAFQCRRDQHWTFTGPPGLLLQKTVLQNCSTGFNILIVTSLYFQIIFKRHNQE